MHLCLFYGSSVLSWVRVAHIKRSFEEVLCKGINRVFWLLRANFLQTLSQERHQVVLQVHANILRACVEDVLLELSVHFYVVFGLLLLLFLDYFL